MRLPLLFHHLCNVSCHFMTSGPCAAHVLDMTSVFFVRPPVCICRLVAPWGLCAKQSPTWSVHTGLALGQAMWHEASMKPTSPEVRIALELVGLRTAPIWARCAQGPRCPPRPWLRSLWAWCACFQKAPAHVVLIASPEMCSVQEAPPPYT